MLEGPSSPDLFYKPILDCSEMLKIAVLQKFSVFSAKFRPMSSLLKLNR